MLKRTRLALVAMPVSALVLAAPADAARKPITGKLSKPGYTVIALAETGKARVVRARTGRFKVRPPARSVTLQLRGPDGVYAGPVVVGRSNRGRLAILGVKPGARLGRIKVRRGYAKVARRIRAKRIDHARRARARRGVPVGAGRFGRVRSRRVRAPGPDDRDLDGIPNVLDVDDDGDLLLDSQDRSSAARTSQEPEERFDMHSRLTLYLDSTANANAAGLTDAQMDAALATGGDLLLTVLPDDRLPNSPELDCGGSIQQPPRPEGLIYCRPAASGGTGTSGYVPNAPPPRFPDCCDLDGDGLGTLRADSAPLGQPSIAMTLHHHATTQQIGTGDFMAQRVSRGGVETAFLASLEYIFATVPAVVSYDDDGPAPPVQVTYPFPGPAPGTAMGGGPGLRHNPAPVSDGPDADDDVQLTLTFWRPQRRAVEEWRETPGSWIDLGNLEYEVQVAESGRRCPQAAFAVSDQQLEPVAPGAGFGPGFRDTIGDRPARPGNTFTYTLNLSRCLETNGFTFNPGDAFAFSFLARSPSRPDNAQQNIFFERQ